VAVTVLPPPSATINAQVELLPLQAPPHPVKLELLAGVAVRVTGVPLTKLALHTPALAVQLTPAGLEVTVPAPVPVSDRLRRWLGLAAVNVAVTLAALKRLKLHEAVPLHGPALHPTKLEPLAGVAMRLRPVPLAKGKLHEETAQRLLPGFTSTVPLPDVRTVSG